VGLDVLVMVWPTQIRAVALVDEIYESFLSASIAQ
jgi:hypothetical protein